MPILKVTKTCKAGIVNGAARCRNLAMEGSEFCSLPAHQAIDAKAAPMPDVVLLWFSLSDSWVGRFKTFLNVLSRTPRRQRELNKKHIAIAETIGRDPHATRNGIVDSGSPVFGAAGIKDHEVWAANVIEDLANAEFFISKALVSEKQIYKGKNVYTESRLLIEFRRAGDGFEGAPIELLGDLFAEFGDASFEKVMVWANPPNDKGEVVHTVNFRGRQIGKPADCALRFYGTNDWLLAAIPPEVPAAPVLVG